MRNALPPNLEKQLLNDMQQRQRSEGFKRGKYYIGGQCLDVPRTSKYFILDEGEVRGAPLPNIVTPVSP